MAVGDKTVLVLVGMTGDGKSTTGNSITDVPNTFVAKNGWQSETRGCSFKDFDIDGTNYRIIDTPGLKDTNLDAEALHERFRGFCDYAPDGVDGFLYVLKKGRFTPETAAAFKAFREACGDAALQHTLILITHAEELEGEDPDDDGGISQKAFRQDVVTDAEKVPSMLECVKSVGVNRIVGVHNKASKRLKKDIRKEIMNVVQEVQISNNGKRYSNEQLKEAEAWRNSIKKGARELEDPDRCRDLLNELSECFHGRKTRDQVEQKMAQLKAVEANFRDIKAKAEAEKKRAEAEGQRADENSKQKEAAEKDKIEAEGKAAEARRSADQAESKAREAQRKADDATAAAQQAAAQQAAPQQQEKPKKQQPRADAGAARGLE